jgi:probable poly-beta-1,6-N-acetyl-D-glucosamine export protein
MSRYLQYIHNLRGIAILYVVGVHSRAFLPEWLSHPEVNRVFDTFLDPSEGNGTVLFLFIGGFLFQHLTHKNYVFKKYIEQKFKVIILPYILISIPLILFRLNTNFESLALPDGFGQRPVIYQAVFYIVTGAHMAPFWFISTIVLFYLSSPLLHVLDNEKFYRYIFPFVFLTCLFTYRPEHNANPLLSYLHYLPIYLTGMWASFNKDKITAVAPGLLYILVASYVCLSVLDLSGWENISRHLTFQQVLSNGMFVVNIYIFKAVILAFMLMLTLYQLQNIEIPFLEMLGHYSFGIFFVHYIFISITRKFMELVAVTINFSVPAYVAYFLFILALSSGTVFLVKKVAGRYSRYVIGS